jgi:hypothetical protein
MSKKKQKKVVKKDEPKQGQVRVKAQVTKEREKYNER